MEELKEAREASRGGEPGRTRSRWLAPAGAGLALAAAAVVVFLVTGDAGSEPGEDTGAGSSLVPLLGVLSLPAPGTVSAEFLDDGTPVFLVHDERIDGPVVLDAESTHRIEQFRKLVAWCEPAGVFEEGLHGSRWHADGSYLGGPASSGLPAYETRVSADGLTIEVGRRLEPPPRSDSAGDGVLAPRGPSCVDILGSVDSPRTVAHYQGTERSPEAAVSARMGGVVAVVGILEQQVDGAKLCSPRRGFVPERSSCQPESPSVEGWPAGSDPDRVLAVEGVFLVRITDGGVTVEATTGSVRELLLERSLD